MPEVATPNQAEREFETGSDEFAKAQSELNSAASAGQDRLAYLNAKRTYDVYQDLDIQTARQALTQQIQLNNIATQALQNAVETSNMVSKQAVKHADVTADAMWNPVQQGTGDVLTAAGYTPNRSVDTASAGVSVAAEAIAAAVAKQVDATITPVLAVLQQVIQALTTATSTIANVVNQTQPKTT